MLRGGVPEGDSALEHRAHDPRVRQGAVVHEVGRARSSSIFTERRSRETATTSQEAPARARRGPTCVLAEGPAAARRRLGEHRAPIGRIGDQRKKALDSSSRASFPAYCLVVSSAAGPTRKARALLPRFGARNCTCDSVASFQPRLGIGGVRGGLELPVHRRERPRPASRASPALRWAQENDGAWTCNKPR